MTYTQLSRLQSLNILIYNINAIICKESVPIILLEELYLFTAKIPLYLYSSAY